LVNPTESTFLVAYYSRNGKAYYDISLNLPAASARSSPISPPAPPVSRDDFDTTIRLTPTLKAIIARTAGLFSTGAYAPAIRIAEAIALLGLQPSAEPITPPLLEPLLLELGIDQLAGALA
jgi:hypothetical protein